VRQTSRHQFLLAFDYGEARTGVAVGQELTGTASPVTTLMTTRGRPDWKQIEVLIREWRPRLIVVGMPRRRDDSPHPLAPKISAFCRTLERRYGIPVHTMDESFTSLEASERLKSLRQGGRRRRVAKTDIDKAAAALLLERWMRAHAGERESTDS